MSEWLVASLAFTCVWPVIKTSTPRLFARVERRVLSPTGEIEWPWNSPILKSPFVTTSVSWSPGKVLGTLVKMMWSLAYISLTWYNDCIVGQCTEKITDLFAVEVSSAQDLVDFGALLLDEMRITYKISYQKRFELFRKFWGSVGNMKIANNQNKNLQDEPGLFRYCTNHGYQPICPWMIFCPTSRCHEYWLHERTHFLLSRKREWGSHLPVSTPKSKMAEEVPRYISSEYLSLNLSRPINYRRWWLSYAPPCQGYPHRAWSPNSFWFRKGWSS